MRCSLSFPYFNFLVGGWLLSASTKFVFLQWNLIQKLKSWWLIWPLFPPCPLDIVQPWHYPPPSSLLKALSILSSQVQSTWRINGPRFAGPSEPLWVPCMSCQLQRAPIPPIPTQAISQIGTQELHRKRKSEKIGQAFCRSWRWKYFALDQFWPRSDPRWQTWDTRKCWTNICLTPNTKL